MSFVVDVSADFKREFKRLGRKYPSLRDDLSELILHLEQAPHQGDALGQGCYKVRMAIRSKGQGKSGGARVITCVVAIREKVYLLSIYDKSEHSTLTKERLQHLLDRIDP